MLGSHHTKIKQASTRVRHYLFYNATAAEAAAEAWIIRKELCGIEGRAEGRGGTVAAEAAAAAAAQSYGKGNSKRERERKIKKDKANAEKMQPM